MTFDKFARVYYLFAVLLTGGKKHWLEYRSGILISHCFILCAFLNITTSFNPFSSKSSQDSDK
jgi:hypothetical protein